jgi:hypothetical protein
MTSGTCSQYPLVTRGKSVPLPARLLGEDATRWPESFSVAPFLPPAAEEPTAFGKLRMAAYMRVRSWGGEDLNLRPTDYEAAAKRRRHLRKWLKALVRLFTWFP